MKFILTIVLLCALSSATNAQHLSSVGHFTLPKSYKILIAGIGNGSFNVLNEKGSTFAAQLGVDWNAINIPGVNKKGKDKLFTVGVLVKYNPMNSRILNDSIAPSKLLFADNENEFMVGLRFRNLQETDVDALNKSGDNGNAKVLQCGFVDMQYTPYGVNKNDRDYKFNTIGVTAGYQIGLCQSMSMGIIGISASLNLSCMSVMEKAGMEGSFTTVFDKTTLAKNYLGPGMKLVFQLNDVGIFFDARKFFSVGDTDGIGGFDDKIAINIGAIASGAIFKTGNKNEEKW